MLSRDSSRPPKVVIVGAGPAGSACAIELRHRSAAEVILIDRASYPRRKVCGSGLSPHALTQLGHLGVLDTLREVHLEMHGLRAVGPSGVEILLQGSKAAWVVPRTELDHRLVLAAVSHGAKLLEGTRVVEVLDGTGNGPCGVRTANEMIEADLVVIANGSPSTFEIEPSPREGIRTIMGWWQGRLPGNVGTMVWDARLEGYYAWAFPEPNDVVNVGLTIAETSPQSHHLRTLFAELLADHFRSVTAGGDPIGQWAGHPATVTTRPGKVATAHTMFVGEAARLVCPATVEGIAFALHSGRLAARTIAESMDTKRALSWPAQERYRLRLLAAMGPMFAAGEGFYRVMRSPRLRAALGHIIDPRRLASRLSHLVGANANAA